MEDSKQSIFYIPGANTQWRFLTNEDDTAFEEKGAHENRGISEEFDINGICNHNNLNQNFILLLEKLEIANKDSDELISLLDSEIGTEDKEQYTHAVISILQATRDNSNDESILNFIHDTHYRRMSINRTANKYKIDLFDARKIIKCYKKNLKAISRNNQKYLGKKCKLGSNQIKFIKDYWQLNRFAPYTLEDLKSYIKTKSWNSWNVSNSTISRCLKEKLKMVYKKINKINPKTKTMQSRRKILESVSAQIKLRQWDATVIYIDEFKYSSQGNNYYGWTEKGKVGYCKLLPNKFQASFMLAISSEKVHGIMATPNTFNAEKFKYFLEQLVNSTTSKYAIICDNAKIHLANLIQKYLAERKISLITIPAYSPFVNPCEKAILIIKSKVRKIERNGKIINLRTFMKWINEITADSLKSWVMESWRETKYFIR